MACLKNCDQSTKNSETLCEITSIDSTALTVSKKRRLRRRNTQRKAAEESKRQPNSDTARSGARKSINKRNTCPQSQNKNSTLIDVATDINETVMMKSRHNLENKTSDSTHNDNTKVKKTTQQKKSSENCTQVEKMSSKAESKTREEILAEREAKKFAKQKTKDKIGTNNVDTVTSTPNIALKTTKATVKPVPKQSVNSLKSKDVTSKSANSNKISNVAKIECTQIKSGAEEIRSEVKKEEYKSKDSPQAEKTREEIKAEREAKKLAKQSAKSKVKGDTESVASKPLTGKASTDNAKTVVESKHSEVDKLAEKLNVVQIQSTTEKEAEDAKSKAALRAERRAKQEAQRAAKENAKVPATKSANVKLGKASKEQITGEKKPIKIEENKTTKVSTLEKTKVKTVKSLHKVKLFQHLYAEREAIPRVALNSKDVHPAIVRLGVQYASRVIAGSNARCISLLNALKVLVTDYVLPAKTEFARGLETYLTSNMAFLKSQRPLAVSMINALKHLRWQLTQLPNNISEFDAKTQLNEAIDTYIREQIEVAGQAISIAVQNKISKGDVILTYGCSSLIEKILCEAWASIQSFSVVVVGSRPGRDGHELLRRLANTGLPCTYVDITALSYVMRKTNKVLLGAGALLANGSVMARAGTAQVALVAHAHNVPVLVCCETHKFSERVQTDSFVYNEIGDPDELVQLPPSTSPLRDWRSIGAVTPLNLTYDVTPPDLVTAVVTELAILPCTSVPVVLRFKLSEYGI